MIVPAGACRDAVSAGEGRGRSGHRRRQRAHRAELGTAGINSKSRLVSCSPRTRRLRGSHDVDEETRALRRAATTTCPRSKPRVRSRADLRFFVETRRRRRIASTDRRARPPFARWPRGFASDTSMPWLRCGRTTSRSSTRSSSVVESGLERHDRRVARVQRRDPARDRRRGGRVDWVTRPRAHASSPRATVRMTQRRRRRAERVARLDLIPRHAPAAGRRRRGRHGHARVSRDGAEPPRCPPSERTRRRSIGPRSHAADAAADGDASVVALAGVETDTARSRVRADRHRRRPGARALTIVRGRRSRDFRPPGLPAGGGEVDFFNRRRRRQLGNDAAAAMRGPDASAASARLLESFESSKSCGVFKRDTLRTTFLFAGGGSAPGGGVSAGAQRAPGEGETGRARPC